MFQQGNITKTRRDGAPKDKDRTKEGMLARGEKGMLELVQSVRSPRYQIRGGLFWVKE